MATYKGHNEDSSGNLLLSIGNGMTATVETGSTASKAYTKGSYIFFNNRFCKATSAIASGATLAIGTNLSETSVGAELTSHLRSSDGKEFYFDLKDGAYGYYPSASKVASEFVPFGGTSDCTIMVTHYRTGYMYIFVTDNTTCKVADTSGHIEYSDSRITLTNSNWLATFKKKCSVIKSTGTTVTTTQYDSGDTMNYDAQTAIYYIV